MEIKILKCDNMVSTGSTVLKAIQNNEMPLLDLLVREVIQNSLDAKKDDKSFVKEEIKIGDFDYKTLNLKFAGISSKLDERYVTNSKFISFSDSHTTGLTGPIRIKDVKEGKWGKFLSLVSNIGKAQENEGAGGSWGYGKTVYYRLGIGLVIFYSRIYENEEFKSRLMACLVENERLEGNILPSVDSLPKSGIAWWGNYENDGEIVPLEDEIEINNILNCFGISPYQGEETGTTVIIPYINENKLLNETYVEDSLVPWWCNNLEDYIKVAIQRWYSTRLMNLQYQGNPWLKLFVNNKEFDIDEDMLPLFKIMQALYNFNVSSEMTGEYQIFKREIKLRLSNIIKDPLVGNLMYIKATKEQLKMLPPENYDSPYTQINNMQEDSNLNHNIIAFCRKPGMILRYDIDGRWTNGLLGVGEDDYVIALFVPNSNNIIKIKETEFTLEEYLRASEKADHENWTDIMQYITPSGIFLDTSNLKIVEKIQTSIKRKLNEEVKKEEEKKVFGVGSKLSRQFTEMFMPKTGFGNKANPPKGSSEKENPPVVKSRISKIELKGLDVIENDYLKKEFQLYVSNTDKRLRFDFKVDAENGVIDVNSWEDSKGIGKKFPVEIKRLVINKIHYKNGNIVEVNEICNSELRSDRYECIFKYSEIFNLAYGFEFNISDMEINQIEGYIVYDFLDSRNKVVIARNKGE